MGGLTAPYLCSHNSALKCLESLLTKKQFENEKDFEDNGDGQRDL